MTGELNPHQTGETSQRLEQSKSVFLLPWPLVAILALGIAIRAGVALHPYSGEKTPPMFGDYEAQRHWMEISLNLPVRDWYRNTTENDLDYWGLDYPPLSGYASYVLGKVVAYVDPDAIRINTSRGYETKLSRAAMRFTVLLGDAFVFAPALFLLVRHVYASRSGGGEGKLEVLSKSVLNVMAFCVTLPALILVDHAHFQYNSISLGLFLFSVLCFCDGYDAIGAAAYCTAVYFKHMTLYTAMSIFTYIISRLLRKSRDHGIVAALGFACKICAAIILTTAASFGPWLHDKDLIVGVFRRLFPLTRGLYEDKVANVWCSISIVVKLNRLLPADRLFTFCAFITVMASLPFCVALAMKPSPVRLLLASTGCALSAFLFSYQVHEKQILIPLMPLAVLYDIYPHLAAWMSITAAFSLFPLLFREGSELAYFATLAFHSVIVLMMQSTVAHSNRLKTTTERFLPLASIVVGWCLNFCLIFVPAPTSAPDVLVLINTIYACGHLCVLYLALMYFVFTS